jgi:hypothetical protein
LDFHNVTNITDEYTWWQRVYISTISTISTISPANGAVHTYLSICWLSLNKYLNNVFLLIKLSNVYIVSLNFVSVNNINKYDMITWRLFNVIKEFAYIAHGVFKDFAEWRYNCVLLPWTNSLNNCSFASSVVSRCIYCYMNTSLYTYLFVNSYHNASIMWNNSLRMNTLLILYNVVSQFELLNVCYW